MLYHKDTGLPDVSLPESYYLQPSFHALAAQRTDRYGRFTLPKRVCFSRENVVELEVRGDVVDKVLLRIPYDTLYDLCLALVPLGQTAIVKTAWLNTKDDNHNTLDISRYKRR